MHFKKDYEKRASDGSQLISVKAGTQVELEEVVDDYYFVKTEKPCTKNGEREFDFSGSNVKEYISD